MYDNDNPIGTGLSVDAQAVLQILRSHEDEAPVIEVVESTSVEKIYIINGKKVDFWVQPILNELLHAGLIVEECFCRYTLSRSKKQ